MNHSVRLFGLLKVFSLCAALTLAGCTGSSIHVTSVVLNTTELDLRVGESEHLIAKVIPSKATNKGLIWATSHSGIAVVDDGVVTGIKEGEATISVVTDDGAKTATCKVNVISGSGEEGNEGNGDEDEDDTRPYVDLSSEGAANCYIVKESGRFKFRATKGNSLKSIGAVASTEVLWESFGTAEAPSAGDLIKRTSYSDQYVRFTVADTFKEGNAVIAAKDSDGTILWSWHIWLVEDEIKSSTYVNNAGVLMDRDLGATSATPGANSSIGLLYQWGRKDPFLGTAEPDLDDGVSDPAASTIDWPEYVISDSTCGTVEYATEHPTTFIVYGDQTYIKEEDNVELFTYDWLYIGNNTDYNLWNSDKTIYDPCPAGWKVAELSVWEDIGLPLDLSEEHDLFDESLGGMILGSDYCSPDAWYPASGYMYWDEDYCPEPIIEEAGTTGACWSSTRDGKWDDAYGLFFWAREMMSGSWDNYSANSIRCQKIQ